MGPIALFDKSFLQGLSVDESVWFDHFFTSIVCPVFYVETLADLALDPSGRRHPHAIIRSLADKFPEMHGSPCVSHATLALANLLGQPVAMDGRIPLGGGRAVQRKGQTGVVYERSPESEAFERWGNGDFQYVEQQFANLWRQSLNNIDLESIAKLFQAMGVSGKAIKSVEHAKALATVMVDGDDHPHERLLLALLFLGVSGDYVRKVQERWISTGQPPLRSYAPYAAFVLEVELFFRIALAADLISHERPSNRTDIAYLYYLPFCMTFISSDKLHSKCAPLFLRQDQSFAWGPDLKTDLARLNTRFASLPDEDKQKGVYSFSSRPPVDSHGMVSQLWDRHFLDWRERDRDVSVPADPKLQETLISMAKSIDDGGTLDPANGEDIGPEGPDELVIKRTIRRKRGNWLQVPRGLKSD